MTRWKLHQSAFVALRNDAGIGAVCRQVAEYIADVAGDGVGVRPLENQYGPTGRARVAVVTESYDAIRREAKEHTLENIVGSMGGGG